MYESGEQLPPEPTVKKLSEVLNFPVDFFSLDEVEQVPPNEISFRAFSRLTAKQKDAALAISSIAISFNRFLEEKFNLPECSVPDLRENDPEAAADAVRAFWKLGNAPIQNVIHLFEAKGIKVFSLANESKDLDAYCFWREGRPYIFVNNDKSTERTTFDLAHELGHLILHRHGGPIGREVEMEADAFASAFLMPKANVISVCPRFVTLESIFQLKVYFRVSAAAMIMRLHKLKLISDWQYRNLYIALSKNGYAKQEPNPLPKESSQLLMKVSSYLRSSGESFNQITEVLKVYPEELNSFVFGLILLPVQGQGKSERSGEKKPSLKLVPAT
jgi:Zn-dependent peptidase ImmA (M78 family)